MNIKIRFNTEREKTDASLRPWRVLVNGEEFLAEKVEIQTEAWTSQDEIAPGLTKWHISCEGEVVWDKDRRICKIVSR